MMRSAKGLRIFDYQPQSRPRMDGDDVIDDQVLDDDQTGFALAFLAPGISTQAFVADLFPGMIIAPQMSRATIFDPTARRRIVPPRAVWHSSLKRATPRQRT
jgi:hypothetical protein